jgi:hypothetical protein
LLLKQSYVLFTAVHPLLKSIGTLIFGDGSDDPLQARLEAVLGQQEASQLRLRSLKEKTSAGQYLMNRATAIGFTPSQPFEVLYSAAM